MTVEVHLDWSGRTHFVGRLFPSIQSQAVSFEYATEWLTRADSFAIDPTSMPLQRGPLHSSFLFGCIQDCGPDRWGRLLIERAVRKKILPTKPYRDLDYVLALDDASRIGALRFRTSADQPFLAANTGKLPPLIQLPALLRATDAIHSETETAKDLRFLLGQGSPLGGARPKSAVQLADGILGIAKFPKPDDIRDIAAGEILALSLARKAGIQTVNHQLVAVGGHGVALITRFDRVGGQRVPFISAATLLGITSGDNGTYTMMADAIRQFGNDVTGDLRELWRRMVFSLLASNHDDHLRNHGFLMHYRGHWTLSPAYDLNPVPEIDRAGMNKTSISEDHPEPSIESALDSAARFGLKPRDAKTILGEVFTAVSAWRKIAKNLKIKAGTLNTYESAFEHPLLDEARTILRN